MTKKIKRILVREPNWVGDNVFTLPAVRELKKRYPEAKISIVTKPGIAPFWELVPEVSEIIPFPFSGGLRDLRKKWEMAQDWKRKNFDLAVIFPRSFESALWTFVSRIPQRWGYAEEGRSFLLTQKARSQHGYRHTHRIDYYYRVLFQGKGEGTIPVAKLPLNPNLLNQARLILQEQTGTTQPSPLIGLHPRASHGPAKCWPLEHFSKLACQLEQDLNAHVLIFGTPIEAELNDRVAKSGGGNIYDLTGKTTLGELAALMACCDVVVGNDTGPIHLAAAVGTPVVALFGSSDPDATSPRGGKVRVLYRDLPCAPCLRQVCPRDTQCLSKILPQEVFNQVRDLLDLSPDTTGQNTNS